MTPERRPKIPENFTYEQGRERRWRRLESVLEGCKCVLRFKNPDGRYQDFFERTVTVLRPLETGPECDRLYVDIHCDSYDREIELRFDKETGCITQQCGCQEQEIGYIVSLQEPPGEYRPVDVAAELEKGQVHRPPASHLGQFPPLIK